MAGIALPYRFQSVNTKFFPISKKDDKVGNSVLAERSIPEDASVRAPGPIFHSNITLIHFLVRFYSLTVLLGLGPVLSKSLESVAYMSARPRPVYIFLHNNCGLTNAGLRERIFQNTHLFGPKRNFCG